MKPSDIAASLPLLAQIRKPAFLWGPPGVGKSQVVAQVATALGIRLIDIRAVLLDPVDLRGLPTVAQGRAAWAIPAFLPEDGAGILFLDELNAAPPLVQAACYQLVLDRALGEYRLPDGWTVFAAGNREGDRAFTSRMSSALANRFVHLVFEPDLDDWSRWALGPGDLRPEVVAFVRWRPELLHRFEPTEKAFPSPRAWASVSRILAAAPPADIEFALYDGTVGQGAAIEFTGFLRVFRALPSLDAILLNPATAPIPVEPSALCAVATGLARRTTEQNFAAVSQYADRLAREYGTLLVKAATARLPGLAHHPAFTRWAVNNGAAHETLHCAALHHTRRGERDLRRWNIACDYAINPLLAEAGFEMPDCVLLDPAYAGMSAEEIYDKLPHDAGDDQDSDDPGGMGGVTDPPPGGASTSDAGASAQPHQPGQIGTRVPSRADLARQEEVWAIATAQAEATAKAMGIGAGDAARAIRAQVAPRVDWRDVLRRYLAATARSDYAWTPPNRRYVARGLYLPSRRSEGLGPVVVAVDTSGSIDDATLAAFAAEITAILDEAAPAAIHVVYCDDAIAGTATYEPGDVIDLSPHGGGGTAFRPVFDWIARSDIQPVCTIYLTDLDGRDFGPAPDAPVLWVSTGSTTAPFGEVIPYR